MITPQGVFAHEFVRVSLQGMSNNERVFEDGGVTRMKHIN